MLIVLAGQWADTERDRWHAALAQALPEARWCLDPAAPEAREARMAVVANPPPGSLQRLPQLRFVQSLWAGVDRLLADPTLPAGLTLARMVDPMMNRAMAETALWAVLSLHRGFFRYGRQQAQRQWHVLPQRRADEVSVAVLGLGEMGRTVARTLQSQGYAVQGWRREPGDDPGVPQRCGAETLPAVLADADVVVNLLPLTPGTRGLLDARAFAAMRPGAALVNLARGAHVVDEDLLAALDRGHLSQAVLDVFHTEPLPSWHRFWTHPQVTVLPHAAAQTDPRSAAEVAAANLRAFAAGQAVRHEVRRDRGY